MRTLVMREWTRKTILLAGAVVLAISGYLLACQTAAGLGYPLDDAWIHQTYARNLIRYGEWSFIPGHPSGGSTAPLWSALIAPAYLLGSSGFGWTMLLGGLGLLGLGWFGQRIFDAINEGNLSLFPWAGFLLVFEWHMIWAAASGMETILYAAAILFVFWRLAAQKEKGWLGTGMLVGLTVWLRPDGLTLLGPVMYVAFFICEGEKKKIQAAVKVMGGFLLLFLPYLVFNYYLAGGWWPNTFFAKQAEYAIRLEAPLFSRFLLLAQLPLVGGGVLLLPGFLWASWQSLVKRRWIIQAAVLWWLGYTLIYALRLPVDYQHGRYLMPAMPVYFLTGFLGTIELWQQHLVRTRVLSMVRKAWVFSLVLVLAAFYFIGAFQAYALDVAIIKTEMVAAADWIALNTEPQAVIAAHDIGALGYFGERTVVDLAGLISPDVIPFIRDEDQLAAYMDKQQTAYLMTFPGWYNRLPAMGKLVFQTDGDFSPQAGGENMAVYRWSGR